jgi:hypothetical protein
LTSISRAVRRWALHHRSDKSLHDLAEMYNPRIRGWINYYSHFYKTQLRPTLKRTGAGATGLALSEYRFGDLLWIVAPFIGVMGTGRGAFYGYGGLGFDIVLAGRWIITPTAAIGYFGHGTGIDLGAHTEFRTGAEFNYRFDNLVRLGVGFYHMSNAGIGSQNPGAELVTLVLTVPLR